MTVQEGGARLRSEILGTSAGDLPDELIILCRVPTQAGLGWAVDRLPEGRDALRLEALIGHLGRLQATAGDSSSWWTFACVRDGWREHGGPASGHDLPWDRSESVLCFGRRTDDPSGVLVAEPHFFMYRCYLPLKAKVRLLGLPWALRSRDAIYAGGDHGRTMPLPGGGTGTPRRLLAQVVADQGLPVTVALGRGVSVPSQMRHRIVLDVDGHVRTWEAWAWKLLSGSVVISQASAWETRFTREFEAGVDYLPVREDFRDLGEVLEWCQTNWDETREIARHGRRKARAIYSTGRVENPSEWRRISAALQPLAQPLPGTRPA